MNAPAVTVVVVIALIIASILQQQQSANASHPHQYKCTYPRTTLYVYTEPVQKECVLLKNSAGVPVNSSTGLPFR